MGKGRGGVGGWAKYSGVSMDLFSDSLMVGAGSALNLGVGLLSPRPAVGWSLGLPGAWWLVGDNAYHAILEQSAR
jgi:hypothetical protein